MNNLKLLRGNKKQSEIAEGIGVSTAYYGMIEIGSRTPSFRIALKIAQYFKVPVEDIFGEENN